METQLKDLLEKPILLQMLTRMGEELERLERLPKTVEDLDNRISSLGKRSFSEEPVRPGLPTISGDSSSNELELKDIRISELESQAAYLESSLNRQGGIFDVIHWCD